MKELVFRFLVTFEGVVKGSGSSRVSVFSCFAFLVSDLVDDVTLF